MTDSETLTNYTELHGCSCKLGQQQLDNLLTNVSLQPQTQMEISIGDDAAVRQIADELCLVTSIDYFTPIVDDPYDYGRIAACNAVSDIFATGATENLTFLAVLGLPEELDSVAKPLLNGIIDMAENVNGTLAGGHTILNPWPIAGASVSATVSSSNVKRVDDATPGDKLYLTKPLGTQPAMAAKRMINSEFEETVRDSTLRPIEDIADEAVSWMTTPNNKVIEAAGDFMSAVTDVTGFGLRGHAEEMANKAGVGIRISEIPIIDGTVVLSELFGYGLETGESAETSGGLLISVRPEKTESFEQTLSANGHYYRQIGQVVPSRGIHFADPNIAPVK